MTGREHINEATAVAGVLRREGSRALHRFATVFALVAALAIVLGAVLSAAHAAGLFKVTQYKVPTANSEPRYIAPGSDGNLWFTEGAEFFTPDPDPEMGGTFHTQIGRITPAGRITEFRVDGCQCFLNDIVQGPGGVLYVTTNSNTLVRITTAGVVLPFVETPFSVGDSLARRGDDLWINDFNTGSIWRYNVPTGNFTEFPTGSTPSGVAVDAQGIVWFSGTDADGAGQIGRLDPATGAVNATPVAGSRPGQIAVASDGKVWFTDRFSHIVGHLDPSNNNRVTQFATLTPDAGPQDIAAANDGSMWFTQATVGNVARITPDGTITEAGKAVKDDPRSGLESAFGVAVFPDDQSVWFTKPADNMVAALRPR
jgi:virginiamycin B lyase